MCSYHSFHRWPYVFPTSLPTRQRAVIWFPSRELSTSSRVTSERSVSLCVLWHKCKHLSFVSCVYDWTIVLLASHSCTLHCPLQVMEKGYKRLTPDQPVGLRHAGYVISLQRVIKVRPSALLTEQGCIDMIMNKLYTEFSFSSLLN